MTLSWLIAKLLVVLACASRRVSDLTQAATKKGSVMPVKNGWFVFSHEGKLVTLQLSAIETITNVNNLAVIRTLSGQSFDLDANDTNDIVGFLPEFPKRKP